MKLHGNARTCPKTRELIAKRVLEEGWSLMAAAAAAGVSEPTARKWVRRFHAEGPGGLSDRSSAPGRIPHRTSPARVRAIEALRRLRMTGAQIAAVLAGCVVGGGVRGDVARVLASLGFPEGLEVAVVDVALRDLLGSRGTRADQKVSKSRS